MQSRNGNVPLNRVEEAKARSSQEMRTNTLDIVQPFLVKVRMDRIDTESHDAQGDWASIYNVPQLWVYSFARAARSRPIEIARRNAAMPKVRTDIQTFKPVLNG